MAHIYLWLPAPVTAGTGGMEIIVPRMFLVHTATAAFQQDDKQCYQQKNFVFHIGTKILK
jgi:hypothetical protein